MGVDKIEDTEASFLHLPKRWRVLFL